MPLYLERSAIHTGFSPPVAEAMLKIAAAMESKAVTPSLAARLIKDHLLPLIPEEHRDVFKLGKPVSWDDIHHVFPTLVFAGEGKHRRLTEVGAAVKFIWEHTKSPPREFVFQNSIEITYFFQMCSHLNLQVEHLRYLDSGAIDLFHFCKYCWRQAVPERAICPVHMVGSKHAGSDQGFLQYKEARRQQPIFETLLNRILTRETMAFHESGFTEQILLPESGIKEWLALRRPHIRDTLALEWEEVSDDAIVGLLLDTLHNAGEMAFSMQHAYRQINATISSHQVMIWPMLLRAEAWLEARNTLRAAWGGPRQGAGRKPR